MATRHLDTLTRTFIAQREKKKKKMERGRYEDGTRKPWMPDGDLAGARTADADKIYGSGIPGKLPNAKKKNRKKQFQYLEPMRHGVVTSHNQPGGYNQGRGRYV